MKKKNYFDRHTFFILIYRFILRAGTTDPVKPGKSGCFEVNKFPFTSILLV